MLPAHARNCPAGLRPRNYTLQRAIRSALAQFVRAFEANEGAVARVQQC